ncbi:unnamed protein product [Arctia plantaginis]|uniref:Leucine-rich repeat-containing protein 71 n=1 Tax=Arctia plantaginis TaxID=874455 RepID=A0A8S0ZN74_ARCPL|nr:unnamed protein product [Arctia plantaginis]
MSRSVQNVQSPRLVTSDKYHPSDLDNFLPWAFTEMGVEAKPVIITRIEQSPDRSFNSSRSKSIKSKEIQTPGLVTPITKSQSKSYQSLEALEDYIKITCIYNSNSQLVKLKFCKNKKIPKCVLKLLTIALPYHTQLTAIHVNGGLSPDLILELRQIVALSNITEVALDNTMLEDAAVYILLEDNLNLKHLSLARCTLNDDMVKALASKLIYPLPASKKLCILNLSTNRITDIGAKCIGNALRTNRQLACLNLSGNMIGDEGAETILNSLKKFALTADELRDMKMRRLQYLKQEHQFKNNRVDEMGKKSIVGKKKVTKPAPTVPLKKGKISDIYKDAEGTSPTDNITIDSCKVYIKDMFGPVEDPFRSEHIVLEHGVTYCLGNNSLCYLNLAYNDVNYFTIEKLCAVLREQTTLNRQPKGLINVCIEGNII